MKIDLKGNGEISDCVMLRLVHEHSMCIGNIFVSNEYMLLSYNSVEGMSGHRY